MVLAGHGENRGLLGRGGGAKRDKAGRDQEPWKQLQVQPSGVDQLQKDKSAPENKQKVSAFFYSKNIMI